MEFPFASPTNSLFASRPEKERASSRFLSREQVAVVVMLPVTVVVVVVVVVASRFIQKLVVSSSSSVATKLNWRRRWFGLVPRALTVRQRPLQGLLPVFFEAL